MRVAIIGASGKTGTKLVSESLRRGYGVVGVCRESSLAKLQAYVAHDGLEVATAPVVSDEEMLTQALAGCDAVVAVLMTVRRLKATELVASLAKATAANGVKRVVFTAGEVTAAPGRGETFTARQRFLGVLGRVISWVSPYSVMDMVEASVLVRRQPGWDWTIIRAPTLRETPASGYRFCEISEVTSKHFLAREDYAACLLDSVAEPDHFRSMLTVVSANQ